MSIPGYIRKLEMKNEKIPRKCLKCEDEFLAYNRFNRICPRCSQENQGYIDYGSKYAHSDNLSSAHVLTREK